MPSLCNEKQVLVVVPLIETTKYAQNFLPLSGISRDVLFDCPISVPL